MSCSAVLAAFCWAPASDAANGITAAKTVKSERIATPQEEIIFLEKVNISTSFAFQFYESLYITGETLMIFGSKKAIKKGSKRRI
jgi:hypothetical protein